MNDVRIEADADHQQKQAPVGAAGIEYRDLPALDRLRDIRFHRLIHPAKTQVADHEIGRAQTDGQQRRRRIGYFDEPLGDGAQSSVAADDDRGAGGRFQLRIRYAIRPLHE